MGDSRGSIVRIVEIKDSFLRSVEEGIEERLPPIIAERLWADYETDALTDFPEAVEAAIGRAADMLIGWSLRASDDREGGRAGGWLGAGSNATREELLMERQRALSESMAIFAAQQESVEWFRGNHLPSGLLALEDVAGWIEARAKADGKATTWLQDLPIPDGHAARHKSPENEHCMIHTDPPLTLSPDMGAMGVTAKVLKYVHSSGSAAVAIRYKGVLWDLYRVGDQLSRRFGWLESEAVTFVLTGTPPWIPLILPLIRIKTPFTALSRIILEVDPVVNHQELAEFYRRVRAARGRGKRWRLQQPKALRLAVFMAERPQVEPPEVRLRDWNALVEAKYSHQDKWTYGEDEVSRFGQDCRSAQELLLVPDYIL